MPHSKFSLLIQSTNIQIQNPKITTKREVNGERIHESFKVMKKELIYFLKYTQFKQDMVKYLRP